MGINIKLFCGYINRVTLFQVIVYCIGVSPCGNEPTWTPAFVDTSSVPSAIVTNGKNAF